jgi:FAD synthase
MAWKEIKKNMIYSMVIFMDKTAIENLNSEELLKKLKKLREKEELLEEILIEKLVEELNLTEKDLEEFEKVREIVWKEEKKKLGL